MEYNNILGSSVDEVVKSYKTYLEVKYPNHLQELKKREKSNPDGVRFEAAIFSMARSYNCQPSIGEVIGEGGVDFLCKDNNHNFILEVTHLDTNSIEKQTGLSNKPVNGEARFFSMITHVLKGRATSKAKQVANYNMPRLLCIGASHTASTLLLGKQAAEWLLTSETKISIPIGVPNAESKIITDLDKSVFFRFNKNGKIEPCRQSISAILLVVLDYNSCLILGILHPEPTYSFDISCFPDVPFCRIANWPCSEGLILTEWLIHNPSAKRVYLDRIELKTEELQTM